MSSTISQTAIPEVSNAPGTPERTIRARHGLAAINLAELWRYRELFLFLSWRDILIRYKQTYLGIAWAVLQPLLTMIVFTVVFGRLAKFPTHGAPYPIITLAGLLPWQFFSNALSESSNSVVASANMISKIYFPRLIVPASAVLSGIIDFLIALGLMAGMMIWYRVSFTAHLLLLPLFFLAACCAAFAAGVWLSALNVKYRDVKYVVPFFTRVGTYASPVGFLSEVVPLRWRFWYNLNPMTGVIDGFRWCILGPAFKPYWPGFCASLGIILILLITGIYYFRSTEKTFADIV
jgi:lipopolysaccharide transport system permease protein